MEKIKYDKYEIYEKGRLYTVVVPKVKVPMWIFECDDCYGYEYSIDGTTKTYKSLMHDMALLANFPNLLVYYPVKNLKELPEITNKYDTVLYRKEVQLKRAVWFKIRRKVDKKHWVGTFSFGYDKNAMNKYAKQKTEPKRFYYQGWNLAKEWIIGDMVFREFSRECCFTVHLDISDSLDVMAKHAQSAEPANIGWIISEKNLQETRERNQRSISCRDFNKEETEQEFFGERYEVIKEICEKGGKLYDYTA